VLQNLHVKEILIILFFKLFNSATKLYKKKKGRDKGIFGQWKNETTCNHIIVQGNRRKIET
jgi:cation transport regulator ChaB